jgi:biopolymer transport protein ExbD
MSNFGSSNSQEVDLNITPIIDCFTVLITFMLASASFLSIGFLEAATPGNSDQAAAEPNTEALIKMQPNHLATLRMKGKVNYTVSFDLGNKEGMEKFDAEFKKLNEATNVNLNQVLLSADDEVEYAAIAEVMDHLNQTKFPVVVGEFQ